MEQGQRFVARKEGGTYDGEDAGLSGVRRTGERYAPAFHSPAFGAVCICKSISLCSLQGRPGVLLRKRNVAVARRTMSSVNCA